VGDDDECLVLGGEYRRPPFLEDGDDCNGDSSSGGSSGAAGSVLAVLRRGDPRWEANGSGEEVSLSSVC